MWGKMNYYDHIDFELFLKCHKNKYEEEIPNKKYLNAIKINEFENKMPTNININICTGKEKINCAISRINALTKKQKMENYNTQMNKSVIKTNKKMKLL